MGRHRREDRRHDRRGLGVRLPLSLSALLIAGVAGIFAWLELTAPMSPMVAQVDVPAPPATPGSENPTAAPQPADTSPQPAMPEAADPERSGQEAAPTPPSAPAAEAQAPATPTPSAGAPAESTPDRDPAGNASAPATPPQSAAVPAPDDRRFQPPGRLILPPTAPSDGLAARLPEVRRDPALPKAPQPGLIERTSFGPLPRIAGDGRRPWKVYAKPFNANDKRPRIAIVLTGLGLSGAATETAISGMSGAVTLAFSPYADNLERWATKARAAGHELLISIPMEPIDYPEVDPGPQVLLIALSQRENLERLWWTLGRMTGYVGLIDLMGSRFTQSRDALAPILTAINRRGLLFVDSRGARRSVVGDIAETVSIPWAASSRVIDGQASREAIDQQLNDLERIARDRGRAIGMGSAYPVTLERLASWIPTLAEKGIAIAPVSAVVGIDAPAKSAER